MVHVTPVTRARTGKWSRPCELTTGANGSLPRSCTRSVAAVYDRSRLWYCPQWYKQAKNRLLRLDESHSVLRKHVKVVRASNSDRPDASLRIIYSCLDAARSSSSET